MKWWLRSCLFILVLSFGEVAQACINDDAKMLWEEKHEHPTLAQAILAPKTEQPDVNYLTNRIAKLKAQPNTNDPAWWNNLAGAYLRLGQPAEAVKLLEPVTNQFSGDYGIHANLGTAYHLLGRYVEAEREIRRDTEINPEGHAGLEKYHLALLQYLIQSEGYRVRHLYVDEFTRGFLIYSHWLRPSKSDLEERKENHPSESERVQMEADTKEILQAAINGTNRSNSLEFGQELYFAGKSDVLPEYATRWDLGADPKLDEGVIYMATLNPKEPACWVMLGAVAARHGDLNLAKVAYEKAVQLGSPQTPILRAELADLDRFHTHSVGLTRPHIFGLPPILYYFAALVILLVYRYVKGVRAAFARRNQSPDQ